MALNMMAPEDPETVVVGRQKLYLLYMNYNPTTPLVWSNLSNAYSFFFLLLLNTKSTKAMLSSLSLDASSPPSRRLFLKLLMSESKDSISLPTADFLSILPRIKAPWGADPLTTASADWGAKRVVAAAATDAVRKSRRAAVDSGWDGEDQQAAWPTKSARIKEAIVFMVSVKKVFCGCVVLCCGQIWKVI